MRFADVGQQLRAYRLESGLRAEEIAARLGVSRAALYRYEKGEVIKLDTIRRLAELLKISPLSLLGIGVEYFSRPLAFLERTRQIEEEADSTDEMDRLWVRGDVATLGRLLQRQIDEAGPEVADALIYRRNAAWAREIDAMMRGRGRVFIAVGTAHLTGDGGVPALLRARGYTVDGP
jgi:uncharacterized protein YbaP (TraB family)